HDGAEIRNLNRVHPGKPDGTLTEQIAYAINRLLSEEKVDVAIDLHEAGVGDRLENVLVAHQRAFMAGVYAGLNLSAQGLHFTLEPSRPEFRGLSHRERGDHTPAPALRTETRSPGQTTESENPAPVNDPKHPPPTRSGRQ